MRAAQNKAAGRALSGASQLFALLLAAILACSALPLCASGRAPDLKLNDPQGQAQKLPALRGHFVVVNFWPTWCGPCQQELPRLSQLAQSLAGKDIRFVAVSIDASRDEAKISPMLDRLHVVPSASFAVWIGSNSCEALLK